MNWQSGTPCVGHTEIFFSEELDDIIAAKRMCMTCPVRIHCLNFAITNGQFSDGSGIWGGTTPKERRAIKRRSRGK